MFSYTSEGVQWGNGIAISRDIEGDLVVICILGTCLGGKEGLRKSLLW